MESHDWENYVDRKIREAQVEGQFDHLPGRGKPFAHLDRDPLGQVLQAQGFAPRWLELDNEIRQKQTSAEKAAQRTFEWLMQTWNGGAASQAFAESEWREARRIFAKRLDEINRLIRVLNLELPEPLRHLQRIPLKADEHLTRLGLPLDLA
jgi:hypothetical protein